jgi:hypothetical protein
MAEAVEDPSEAVVGLADTAPKLNLVIEFS